MYDCLITFRSVMPAQRAEALVQRAGIGCAVRRTAKWMEKQGCGYSLHLPYGRLYEVLALLEANGVRYRKVYLHRENGGLEEVML